MLSHKGTSRSLYDVQDFIYSIFLLRNGLFETVLTVINGDVAPDNCVPAAKFGWVCDGMNEKFMKNKLD